MLLQLAGIRKFFPGVKALDGISFDLVPGEVHAVCGENGAGKSTLMNLLTGNLQPDAGAIFLKEKEVSISDPSDAGAKGIAIVYQHLSLVDSLSVAENIFANTQPKNRLGFIQFEKLYSQTKQLLQSLDLQAINPKQLVGSLSPGEKQMVEIAKALSKNPDVLILDEPTASITEKETRSLFAIIQKLQAANRSVIYISHRLKEIFEIADRVTVLKDGRYQGTFEINQLSEKSLIQLMVGREIVNERSSSTSTNAELLRVENLSGNGFVNVSFTIAKGEIIGLSGLIGAGRTEIAQAIFGYTKPASGKIFFEGVEILLRHPEDAIAKGIAYVPEDRKLNGLFPDKTVTENICVADMNSGSYHESVAVANAVEYKNKLRIATPDLNQKVINLSGGNQQKVMLARWLLTNPKLLIVDEPTHGIDIGAKFEIYQILRELAASGKAVLLISSELHELMVLTDRIIVIKNGTISGEVKSEHATEEHLLELATG